LKRFFAFVLAIDGSLAASLNSVCFARWCIFSRIFLCTDIVRFLSLQAQKTRRLMKQQHRITLKIN